MITAAEQYRALVAKLEAINPSIVNEKVTLNPDGTVPPTETVTLPNGGTIVQRAKAAPAHPGNPADWANGINPPVDWVKDNATGKYSPPTAAAPAASAPVAEPAAAPAPAAAAAPNVEQQIMNAPTFSQAYAMAKKAGLKTFKYCKTYAVKDAPVVRPPVQPKPSAPAQKVDYTNQASPLGGDAENPMSFAANSNFGA